ncbi:hypothetical protein AB0N73_10180 [Microbacterium sp. NPDC089189]
MSFLGNGPDGSDPQKPSPARIGIWIVVGGIGVFMLASGVIGIVSGGN